MSKSLGNVTAPAGRDQGVAAPTSCACGSRPRTIPTTCASGRRSSRPSSRPTASCATRSAGCWARCTIFGRRTASQVEAMPELERFVLHRLAELDEEVREAYRRVRLQARRGAPQRVHDERPLGLLLRHPQGRALLRPDLQPGAQERAHRRSTRPSAASSPGSRRSSPSRPRRPGSSRYPGRGSVHLETFPETPARVARRCARRALGEGAPRPPRRHRRARDRAGARSASARASRRRPTVHVADDALLAGARGRRLRRGLHHLRRSR